MSSTPLPLPPEAAAAPRCWQQDKRSSDIDELARAQPEWSLHYEQLSAGGFAGTLRQVQLPGVRLVMERLNRAVRQVGDIGAGGVGFAMGVEARGAGQQAGRLLRPLSESLSVS